MKLPLVSRSRYEDLERRFEEVKAENAKLLDIALYKSFNSESASEEPIATEDTLPHRPMIADIRASANRWAQAKYQLRAKA